ncbi:hypothetical protein COLO4_07941 [Corchorus olitorius]|uniref:Tf2-1-like SH3-like domain-containing protein n=1 Tax=Corchorus olitorius TaxID=93759 RepID=A0A1R3KI61_9ROSI|nr:hypothetical protein COLO4_07941 [Corchorus olitorius]
MTVAKAIPVPSASCLLFLGDLPCVVPATILPRSGKKIISELQFKKGIKRGEPSYIVMPVCKENGSSDGVPSAVETVLPHTPVDLYRGKSPRAFTFAKDWKQNTEIARAYLKKASKWMMRWADKDRRPQQFQVGDLVLVKLVPEQLRFLRKRDRRLVRKYEGRVKIIARVGNTFDKIEPPSWMKVPPVFHVCNLKPFHADPNNPSRSKAIRTTISMKPPS